MSVSVVIPLRDTVSVLAPLLVQLQALRSEDFEVIVVEAEPPLIDSGLTLDEPANAGQSQSIRQQVDQWLLCPPGRALQQQRGADAASHPMLWFLHADSTNVVEPGLWLKAHGLAAADAHERGAWGRFDVCFDDQARVLRMVAWFMNVRSRLTRVFTGDQGIWVSSRLLKHAGGWPQQLLMEDIELSKRLRELVPPSLGEHTPVLVTSARRWREKGAWRTIVLMWWLRLRYACGADPAKLHALYYGDAE